MFNRIDRTLSQLFWQYFLGGLIVFVALFLVIDAMSKLVTYPDAGHLAVGRFLLYSIPEVVYRMLPVASLLALLFTLSGLQRSSELIAMMSLGMSLRRILRPLFVWVIVVSALGFYLSDQVLPPMARLKNFVFFHELENKPGLYSIVKTDRIWYRSRDTIFNIKTLNQDAKTAQGLTLYTFDIGWRLLQMMTAEKVFLQGSQWELRNGSVTLFTEDSSFPLTQNFKSKVIEMNEDADGLGSTAATSDILSVQELSQFITKNKEAGLDTLRYEVDYHAKFGFAFAGIVMTLLGVPFALGRVRSGGTLVNLGMCLGVVFAYWVFYSLSLTMGYNGVILPALAAWLPNGVMFLIALFLIKRLNR